MLTLEGKFQRGRRPESHNLRYPIFTFFPKKEHSTSRNDTIFSNCLFFCISAYLCYVYILRVNFPFGQKKEEKKVGTEGKKQKKTLL